MAQKDPDISSFTVSSIAKEGEKMAKDSAKSAEAQKRQPITSKLKDKIVDNAMKEEFERKRREEQEYEERALIRIMHNIKAYVERFPWLMDVVPKLPTRPTFAQATEILKLIEERLDAHGSQERVAAWIGYGLMGIEQMWKTLGDKKWLPEQLRFNVDGMSKTYGAALSQGFNVEGLSDWHQIVDELDIKHPWIGRSSLYGRLFQMVFKTMLYQHTLNTNPQVKKMANMASAQPVELKEEEKI
jgi:hypothetical protein